MDLRALLFTSDGGSSATLCQVLTDLGIEAEICPEMLVAAGRIAREHYDALIVDWSNEAEATLLLKTARDKKALSLNLVLVSDEPSIARALQQGANSVIKKPIDVEQARDTLSTARDLIQSRRSEQRDKEASRAAAASAAAAVQADSESFPEMAVEAMLAPPEQTAPARKTGFLQQSLSRSAFEAEEKIVKPEYLGPSSFQVARGPASIQEDRETEAPAAEPVTKKRWDEVRAVFREKPEEPKTEAVALPGPQDSTGVFSSLPEEPEPTEASEEPAAEREGSSLPSYLVFAVVACLLVAAVLYVWAPGDSYLGRVTTAFHAFWVKTRSNDAQPKAPPPAPQVTATTTPVAPPTSASTEEFAGEAGPIPSTEIDPNKIQIIETKAIPKAGAQQPPSKDPVPDTNNSQSPVTAEATPETSALTEQAPVEQPPAVQAPVVAPEVPVHQLAPAPKAVSVNPPSPSEGRTGVIIPDSLKASPAQSPASTLEPSMVPEETSLGLLIHRVDPAYPQQALQQHLDGPVVLQAWIARDGSVRDVKLVKGYFALARAASDAVKQWRFKPYSPNGRAIDFQTVLTVNFKYPN